MVVSIIVAMSENRVIGRAGRIPWHIPDDLKWFKAKTLDHAVIMGRKTYESIGRPLPGRQNIIISRRKGYKVSGAEVFHSIADALMELKDTQKEEVFIIGGAQIFQEVLPCTDRIYLTLVHREYKGDTFFPELTEGRFEEVKSTAVSGTLPFTIKIFERKSTA